MNAIILSAQDAAFIARPAYDEETAAKKFDRIRYGTPGYSWLSVVPDEALEDLLNGTSTVNQGQLWCDLESEIARRKNLKPPKD